MNGRTVRTLSVAEVGRIMSGRMPALDGLRGIALLVVMLVHFTWYATLFPNRTITGFLALVSGGWMAMESFFVLSGFLITGILLDTKEAENYFSSFYIRRALRILPVYYGTLLVGCILCPLLGKAGVPFLPKEFPASQLWYWFYAGNWASFRYKEIPYFGHLWSLAVEEQFYVVWPCVVFLTRRRTLAKICIVMALVSPVLRIFFDLRGFERWQTYFLTTSHLDSLGLGALGALIIRDEKWVRRLIPRLSFFIYPSLAIICLLGTVKWSLNLDESPTFIYGVLPVAILFTALVLRAVVTTGSRTPLQRFLGLRGLRSCGKYSYAIYVYHWPLARFYFDHVVPHLVAFLRGTVLRYWVHRPGILIGVCLGTLFVVHLVLYYLFFFGLGKLSWWAFEGRINNRKDRFEPRWRHAASAEAGQPSA